MNIRDRPSVSVSVSIAWDTKVHLRDPDSTGLPQGPETAF